ncbi:YARHG domain-containing protein [Reichenbachiella sp. MSK19-1]|uniref:YARHG domain-containing protein n=1 Tax=Reichenbachiella sp. MSK19-1 TaxID=1897631 RepID=UPI000E6C7CED|nr:YARHG domain-containing protein [Reichenbachiella sp. MSK19-1]RJE70587.1 hypothetical protein BGP76_10900 [Reichenbachiella sp. MSK19-1]
MKLYKLILLALFFSFSCTSQIKDENAQTVVEEGTNFDSIQTDRIESISSDIKEEKDNNAYEEITFSNEKVDTNSNTYWVGFFNPHKDIEMEGKHVFADEGLYWGRRNKISISIDEVIEDSIVGHSVVAGNHRPFYGKIQLTDKGKKCIVKEPGDDKYDGQFTFEIVNDHLIGVWTAYENIEIPKREYKLNQMSYKYDKDIMLERAGRYGNWDKFIDHGTQIEIYDEGTPDEQVYEWVKREYASSTEKIYEINASNKELTKEDVENLTNSDLVVIRNTIYARHGYSFKNRPLRVFFDAQDWYIPVHADIKQDFTEIEKKNIQLLLRYEKNAKEYYDYFGRG